MENQNGVSELTDTIARSDGVGLQVSKTKEPNLSEIRL